MKPITDPLSEIMSMVPRLTDEEWIEKDRQVAADRSRLDQLSRPEAPRDRLAESGWPTRLLEALPTARTDSEAIRAIASWRDTEHCIAVLSGSVGCGKTLAAAWWARRRGAMGFVRASTFARMSRYGDEHHGLLERQALCLDDLGAEYLDAKGSFVVDLDELIDTYHADMKPLIITTNCNWTQFEGRYGSRITDRLRECGEWISLEGKSMRGTR